MYPSFNRAHRQTDKRGPAVGERGEGAGFDHDNMKTSGATELFIAPVGVDCPTTCLKVESSPSTLLCILIHPRQGQGQLMGTLEMTVQMCIYRMLNNYYYYHSPTSTDIHNK